MLPYLRATTDKCSHQRDLNAAVHLNSFFKGKNMNDLVARDVRGYIEFRRGKVKPSTINRELCLLSAAINFARREWEWDLPNPISGRKLKEPEGRVRWIARAEAHALIKAAENEPGAPHLADFVRLALHTGCRKQEMLGLEWERVDLRQNLFFLEPEHTKTTKRRSIPLNQVARSSLLGRANFRTKHCPDSPWVFCHKDGRRVKDVRRSFATACQRAGIQNFRIHDMRHTCAAWLVSSNVPLTAVKDLLGHTSVKMTERYAHLAPENVREAVNALDETWSHSGHSGVDGIVRDEEVTALRG